MYEICAKTFVKKHSCALQLFLCALIHDLRARALAQSLEGTLLVSCFPDPGSADAERKHLSWWSLTS